MPNDNATMTKTQERVHAVCVSCSGELTKRQQKYCARIKCQAKKARDLTQYGNQRIAERRRAAFEKEVANRKCQGCNKKLGPEYRRGARFHGEACRILYHANTNTN